MENQIKQVYSYNTGGGCMVDYVILENDTTISISDEVIMLNSTIKEDELFEEDKITGYVQIDEHGLNIDPHSMKGEGTYVKLTKDSLIVMKNGIVISIEKSFINVYENMDHFLYQSGMLIGQLDRTIPADLNDLKKATKEFYESYKKLVEMWEDKPELCDRFLNGQYPFQRSFDDQFKDVREWLEHNKLID